MEQKVSLIHSFRGKIFIMIVVAVLFTGALMVWNYSPGVKSSISSMSKNYLEDLSVAYGAMLEDEIEVLGKEKVLSSEYLSERLAEVKLGGVESSYAYLVSPEGTMMYHPTPEKIGEPVENEVVKGCVSDIKAGKKVDNGLVEYEFKGVIKYAAVYVNETQDFILVVTTDEAEILQPISDMNRKGILGMLLCLVVCSVVGFIMATRIVKPILRTVHLTARIAKMDFREDVEQQALNKRKDEMGLMARSINELQNELCSITNAIKQNSSTLKEAAEVLKVNSADTNLTMEQVESAVNEIANGATSQADETQKATENVVSMGKMVEETSEKVDKLMDSAKRMQEANQNAQQILIELKDISVRSEQHIDVIAKQTDVTNESALRIGEATKVIAEIAEETNLLSLNASIEAARAGEQGRGFAVVASEIQKLAEQSTDSAKVIDDIIKMLLADSEKAVETMGQVKKIIKEQTAHMERTDDAFEKIQQGVTESIDGMKVIADKTKALDEARIGVVDVVNNLTAIAEENAASTEETSASVVEVASIVTGISDKAEELNVLAEEMMDKMNVFKVE